MPEGEVVEASVDLDSLKYNPKGVGIHAAAAPMITTEFPNEVPFLSS